MPALSANRPAVKNAFIQVFHHLVNQRLQSYADGYLAELRADAVIRYQ